MNLRGKTVIELRDAKTGKITNRVEKYNTVTNAITNILNGGLNALVASQNNGVGKHNYLSYLYTLPNGYNIAKALFGGVLIFSKSINTSEEHCIPSVEEMKSFIGCANQGSSITGNNFKGSFNSDESEFTDTYAKFVWDFTTNQCNGDIASICLTSDCGGSLGYKFNAISNKTDAHTLGFVNTGMWDASLSVDYGSSNSNLHNPMLLSSFNTSNAHDTYINGEYFYYVYRNSVYKYNINRLLNKNGSCINESFNYGKLSGYDELITLTQTLTNVIKCVDEDKVFQYNSQSDSSKFDILKISGNAEEESISIPTTNLLESLSTYMGYSFTGQPLSSTYKNNIVIFNNNIYLLVGQVNYTDKDTNPDMLRMYKISFDGSFTYYDIDITDTVISMLFGTTQYGGTNKTLDMTYTKIFDTLVLISKDSTNGFKYFFVNDNCSIDSFPFMACEDDLSYYGYGLYNNSDWLKQPWCSFRLAGNGVVNTTELWMPYLATINNQNPVLTKTADKTMKIIYTLTQS